MDNKIINDLMEWSKLRPDHKADRGATSQEIIDAERRMGYIFPDDYRWFLESYGGGQYGPFALIGLRHSSEMSVHVRNIFSAREFYNRDWIPEEMIIISDDDSGNLWLMDRKGTVYFADHEEQSVESMYKSYSEWFEGELLSSP
jgi:hypothetical protein